MLAKKEFPAENGRFTGEPKNTENLKIKPGIRSAKIDIVEALRFKAYDAFLFLRDET